MKNQKRICIGREEGRFSNSKAVPSFLVSLLSSPPPPPSHPICRATCAILHPRVSSRVSYIVFVFFPSQVVRKIMPRGERGLKSNCRGSRQSNQTRLHTAPATRSLSGLFRDRIQSKRAASWAGRKRRVLRKQLDFRNVKAKSARKILLPEVNFA